MTCRRTAETTPRELTVAMEDAITGIYRLQETTDERVSTSELAAELDVTSTTISNMFTKLADRGLIDREPHRPVALKDSGREIALRLIRNHRILETYLVECLGYGWEEVHKECDRLEHHVSQRFINSLESFLSNPETDPHGDPIPNVDLVMPKRSDRVHLDTITEGTAVTIQRILGEDREILEYLASTGFEPEQSLTVEEQTPIGLVVVMMSDGQQQLPLEIAHQILVSPYEAT